MSAEESNALCKEKYVGMTNVNMQGCLMQCIEYINSSNAKIRFLDEYQYEVVTCINNFKTGRIKNPFAPHVHGIGSVGVKYEITKNKRHIKEYTAWCGILFRTTESFKRKYPTYTDCTICNEWLHFPNFYDWLHSQENFDKWLEGEKWCVDKDIIQKGNKIYTPEYCCLVPNNVNTLFVKKDANRGDLPLGVTRNHKRYMAACSNPLIGNTRFYLGTYDTPYEAYIAYKKYKEKLIKEIAEIEFQKGNITKECYDGMFRYVVEITD